MYSLAYISLQNELWYILTGSTNVPFLHSELSVSTYESVV